MQSQVRCHRVPEKVPEKVPEGLVDSRLSPGSGGGFPSRSGGFGAEPGQSQQDLRSFFGNLKRLTCRGGQTTFCRRDTGAGAEKTGKESITTWNHNSVQTD